ncbi:MAG: hypothetical protein M1610_06785 [Nitrospirae bacterium]|nr:hypothetical protein [Nitrospirota bacterium]MDA8214467.1 hypothetical protein [Nitrospiraceae bacterium]
MRGKGFYVALFTVAVLLVGCASSSVRFTQDEIKDYPLDIQERIIKGEVAPGMTQQQVRYAWGNPDSVKKLEPENGKPKEEWIYSSVLGAFKTRLIFIDGKLTYIISTEPGRVAK